MISRPGRALYALALFAAPVAACAQGMAQASTPTTAITYHYRDSALTPPAWGLMVRADGTGTYQIDGAPSAERITISALLLQALFAAARRDHYFRQACQAPHDHTAYTGDKTLTYTGPEGTGTCSFSYAKDDRLNALAAELAAVATTLEEGKALCSKLAHDRLGLDAALEQLTGDKANGRAAEMQNIAPVLRSIAADPQVLNHARAMAQALLATP